MDRYLNFLKVSSSYEIPFSDDERVTFIHSRD